MSSKWKYGLLSGAATVAVVTIGMMSSAVAAPPEWCSKIAGGIYCAQSEAKVPDFCGTKKIAVALADGYTLTSIAAVILGGASLFGGRGAFIGVLFGAVLIQEINSVTTFLSLSQSWQYWFIGFITLIAVAIYSQARRAHNEE